MTTIGPKKDGGPNVEYFQSPESLGQFDQIRVWLQKNCKKHVQTDPPTKEGLAQLVVQLIQYQENKLGKNAADPPFLRLPMKVFMDMKPGGSLCTVLATMFRFKSEQRWRKFDFQVGKVCTVPHAASLTDPVSQSCRPAQITCIAQLCVTLRLSMPRCRRWNAKKSSFKQM